MLVKIQCSITKSKGKSKHLKENGSENTAFPNLWDAPKGVITGKLMAMQPKLSPKGISEKENKQTNPGTSAEGWSSYGAEKKSIK